jgi:CRP/FNR family cyclic AMP-dependent transcriptional regulator
MPYAQLLQQVDIFSDFDEERLTRISNICKERQYTKGELIFRENTDSDELYVILQGEIEIQVDPRTLGISDESAPGPTTIATLRRGQTFGEVALVDEGFRSASACAATQAKLLVIGRDDLIQMCSEDFELGYILMRNVATDLAFKIRQTDLMVREQLLWGPRK